MLRLRPSELTLTPEDVEETFRRMAHKQALKTSRRFTSQPCGQPGRPVLCRGPQRTVRDDIMTLGDIPILRPQPQQALQLSVDEDIEENSEIQGSRERVDSVSGPISPTQETLTAQAATPTSSALRILQLPFRLGRGHRDSSTQPTQEDPDADQAHLLSTRLSTHPLDDSRATTRSGETRESSLHAHPTTSTRSPAELRGGGPSGRDRGHTARRDMLTAPSPPTQVQDRSAPHDEEPQPYQTDSESNEEEYPPILHLQGYFTHPRTHPEGRSYWFHEVKHRVPQSEPRHRSGRHAVPTRSLSSGSAPAYSLPRSRIGPSGSSAEEVFGSVAKFQPPVRHGEGPSSSSNHDLAAGSRRFSSEASAASEAYSYYQLPPESRHSSSERSAYSQQPHPQLDGSAASRHTSCGIYRSVHPSQVNASNAPFSTPTSIGDHYGISPLPSMPYGNPIPPSHPMGTSPTAPSFLPDSYMDAGQAAAQGLPSPLDPYSEYYQNLINSQTARQTMPASLPPYHYAPQGPPQQSSGARHNAFAQPRRDDGLPHHVQALPPARQTTSSHGSASRHATQAPGRSSQATRANQRSSENVPVALSASSDRPNRNSQVQRHREAFERLHNTDLPHPVAPHDTSNRPRTQVIRHSGPSTSRGQMGRLAPPTSSSPLPPLTQPQASQSNNPSPASALGGSPGMPPRIPPRYGSNMRSRGVPERSQTRARRQLTPAPPAIHLHPSRDLPSTSLALDHASATTSIRSPLVRTTTSARQRPRVPPHRRNQENSGAGEDQLMRQEETAFNARYGEDVQRDVMDETPPRVGRVERRMFS